MGLLVDAIADSNPTGRHEPETIQSLQADQVTIVHVAVEASSPIDDIFSCFAIDPSYYFKVEGNGMPSVPRGIIGLCVSYDRDRNIFWLIGGTADTVPDASNFTVIFNYTTFERGNYNHAYQDGLFGEQKINGTGIRAGGANELMYGGACGFQNNKLISILAEEKMVY